MVVEVRLFATFRHNRFKIDQLKLPQKTTPADIIRKLKIVPQEVGILLVNGKRSKEDQILSQNDVVSIFPMLGGG